MSDLLWIAVPGGTQAGSRLLRVLVVPRLDSGTLASCGLADWPPRALLEAQLKLTLTWRADESAPETQTRESVHIEDGLALWRELFEPGTSVAPAARRTNAERLTVAPTSELAGTIDSTYREPARVAVSKDAPAPPEFRQKVEEGLAKWRGPRPDGGTRRSPRRPRSAHAEPGFHQTLGALREHPNVLRALGFVFDLQVLPPDPLLEAGQVKVSWPEAPSTLAAIVSPWTRYDRGFFPGATPLHSAGMVTLTPDVDGPGSQGGGWHVATVDVDTGARRLRDAAVGASPPTLPAMRTAGIQLLRPRRGQELVDRRDAGRRNALDASLDRKVLDSDDLVLGYRMDIRRDHSDWLSLHARIAAYTIGGVPVGPQEIREEGHLKANGARRIDAEQLAADEVVARWSGWSLAVARPRFAPGAPKPKPTVRRPFAFQIGLDPHGKLPKLRFTSRYDVRLRVVDVAGGGLAADDIRADRCAIRDQEYGRHEPVSSPAVVLEPSVEPGHLGPGESVACVVIRAEPGLPATPRRSLLRPQTTLNVAEHHNAFEDSHFDDEQSFELVQKASAGGQDAIPDPAAEGVSAFPVPAAGSPAAETLAVGWPPWPQGGTRHVELRSRNPGEPVTRWEDDTLIVRLKPAEQLDVEFSSTLRGNFKDHFHLFDVMPASSKDAVGLGRHPLVTPAQTVTFVHAVRKPLPADAGTGLSTASRQPEQTSITLTPGDVFKVDGNSTVQLDVKAAWTDRTDAGTSPGSAVQSFPIARGQKELDAEVHFEFADTRHRLVTCNLSAVGRFRQFFAPGPAGDFCLETPPLPVVNVLSTARPAPPVVLGVRPAFRWIDEPEGSLGPGILRRTREGGRLRVELARPWYLTGEGERLAVVLWDHSGSAPADDLLAHVTQAGRDPIWDTGEVDRWPEPSTFFDVPEPQGKPRLADRSERIVAVPHEPFLDDAGASWWADVRLAGLASSSYAPFVRLALARYQPNSLDGLELSQVVLAPMAQLLPDRTVTLIRAASSVSVTLDGLGPTGPQPNRVDVVLETSAAPGTTDLTAFEAPAGDVTAWVAVPDAVQHGGLGDELSLTLPAGPGALRVRVREVELVGAVSGAPAPKPQTGTVDELEERTVFVETIAVPAAP